MPIMSCVEQAFCRSGLWRGFARRVILPWALQGHDLAGDVLEMGSGSGAMAQGIATTYPRATLIAADIDPRMVQMAQRRLRHLPRAAAEVADVTNLPFSAMSFDTVVSFLMLHHVLDWELALHEAGRVLRPGGLFIGYDLSDSRVARAVHALDRSPHRMLSPISVEPILRQAGFREIDVHTTLAGPTFSFSARRAVVESASAPTQSPPED